MKTREEILKKAASLSYFAEGSVQAEASLILIDIAGADEADMFSEAGVQDLLFSLDKDPDETVQGASKVVQDFLNS